MLITATEGENAETFLELWKQFNIQHAVHGIVEAWNEMKKSVCMVFGSPFYPVLFVILQTCKKKLPNCRLGLIKRKKRT